ASAPLPASSAHAAAFEPAIRPRSAWGADESVRGGTPSYASSLRGVTLHHTASSSSYGPEDVPGLLRGFYAYHVKSNGWSDIGYNFLVDRFGTIWEGRYGGTTRSVIGAHAGGFNTGTAGISMIGTYGTDQPSASMLESVAQLAAWKMGRAGIDPRGSVTLTSAGSTRYRSGTPVRLPTLFAHQDVSTTSCPGTLGMAALPGLRDRAAQLAAGAVPQAPTPVPDAGAHDLEGRLRVEVPPAAPLGSTVEVTVTGTPHRPVDLWFAHGDGSPATLRREATFGADGRYRTSFTADGTYVLFAVSDGLSSPRVQTSAAGAPEPGPAPASPLSISGPVTVEAHGPALVTVTGPAGTNVSVWFRAHGEDAYARRRAGTLGPDGSWTTTFAVNEPHDYFAMSATVTSPDATTVVGAVPHGLHVTTPRDADGGTSVPVVVQGVPGSSVELWFARADGPFTRRREGVLAADGTFRTSWTATDEHTVYAVSRNRTSTRVTTRVSGSVPYTPASSATTPPVQVTAPAGVDAGQAVEVTATGPAGAPVRLWFKPRGEAVFTQRRAGVFDASGVYRTTYVGLDDQELYATTGGSASADVGSITRPVLTAPGSGRLGRTVTITGRARPGDAVVVEQRRRNGAVTSRTARAGGSGAFTLAVPLLDESQFRPSVGSRTGSVWSTTKVAPTVAGPARAGRGSTVTLTGTARPGALVEVLFRARGAAAFTVRRRLAADPAGRFVTTASLGTAHRYYARADGLASAQQITDVR
ncbi:MAG: repeat protein, partial [Frankiales bacterium]|nr:repeat protein [Frankiales bacterium]